MLARRDVDPALRGWEARFSDLNEMYGPVEADDRLSTLNRDQREQLALIVESMSGDAPSV